MIPRLKPYLGWTEAVALFQPQPNTITRFEAQFARTFEAKHAIAFPYGRSALWAFFKALGIENAEIIMPAYTCSVVAHAIVLSGNVPRFVDITLYDYNMELDQVERAINERTRAIIATHLFGYPLDVDTLQAIVRQAEVRYGHKLWVIQDCAHSFGARWQGKLVCNEGDAAFFGLNISKLITSIFGGMLTTNDPEFYGKLRVFQDKHFTRSGLWKRIHRSLYLLALYLAFNEQIYGLVNQLEENTPFLNRLTRAYHLDEKIHFPPDYLDQMLAVEAQVGLAQLRKYPEIIRARWETACFYNEQLREVQRLTLPPLIEGATYSHYVIRIADREAALQAFKQKGIQLGELIQYSLPHLAAYKQWARDDEFPHSRLCSRQTINLPVHHDISPTKRDRIVRELRAVFG